MPRDLVLAQNVISLRRKVQALLAQSVVLRDATKMVDIGPRADKRCGWV
jgi:hypothetical protein